jgi:hypothetical protein
MKNDIEITVLCFPGVTLSFQPDGIAGISAWGHSHFYVLGFFDCAFTFTFFTRIFNYFPRATALIALLSISSAALRVNVSKRIFSGGIFCDNRYDTR